MADQSHKDEIKKVLAYKKIAPIAPYKSVEVSEFKEYDDLEQLAVLLEDGRKFTFGFAEFADMATKQDELAKLAAEAAKTSGKSKK